MKEQKQLSMKRSAALQDCDALEKALVKLTGMSEKELKNAKKSVWFAWNTFTLAPVMNGHMTHMAA